MRHLLARRRRIADGAIRLSDRPHPAPDDGRRGRRSWLAPPCCPAPLLSPDAVRRSAPAVRSPRLAASTPRHDCSTGGVLITGGQSRPDDTERVDLATAEVWDPKTETSSATGPLHEPRAFHSATTLPDGRVLVVGGLDNYDGSVHATAEVWDPTTGMFTPTGSLATGRGTRPRVLLPDGRSSSWVAARVLRGRPDGGAVGSRDRHVRPGWIAHRCAVRPHRHGPVRRQGARGRGWRHPGSIRYDRAVGPGLDDLQPGALAHRGPRRPHGDRPARRPRARDRRTVAPLATSPPPRSGTPRRRPSARRVP